MSFMTFDARTVDSTGAFFVSELQKMDYKLHLPLAAYTWSRDVDPRTDIDIGHESTSFMLQAWAGTGGAVPSGKRWVSKASTTLPAVSVDAGQVVSSLTPWAAEVSYTVAQLQSSMLLNRPIDEQQVSALQEMYQMDIDEQVYIGDTGLSQTGLCNKTGVTATNVVAGTSSSTLWKNKSEKEILTDVNTVLNLAWVASGLKYAPRKILLPPEQFTYINTTTVSSAMPMSIKTYLEQNSICNALNNAPLEIQYCKWLTGRGSGSTDRMVAYTQEYDVVRFPMTKLIALPVQYKGVYMSVPYICKLGELEVVRPEMFYYADGI